MWRRCPGQGKGQRNVTPLQRSRHLAGSRALSQALGTWGLEAGQPRERGGARYADEKAKQQCEC